MTDVTETELWRSLHNLLRGYRSAQVVIACNELGVFEVLTPGARAAVEVADRTGSDVEATRRLLDAAVALGLLVKDGDRYANSRLAQVCLTPDSPCYMGHLASLEAAAYERWGHLAEAVRLGTLGQMADSDHAPHIAQRQACAGELTTASPVHWMAMKRSFLTPQMGHTSGAAPRTVLPHTSQTKIAASAISLPLLSALSASLYRP